MYNPGHIEDIDHPDWSFWTQKMMLMVWEFIALSLGLNPKALFPSNISATFHGLPKAKEKDFYNRIDITLSQLKHEQKIQIMQITSFLELPFSTLFELSVNKQWPLPTQLASIKNKQKLDAWFLTEKKLKKYLQMTGFTLWEAVCLSLKINPESTLHHKKPEPCEIPKAMPEDLAIELIERYEILDSYVTIKIEELLSSKFIVHYTIEKTEISPELFVSWAKSKGWNEEPYLMPNA